MKNIFLITATLLLYGFVQIAVAADSNLPIYVTIGQETKAITFHPDNTAIVDVKPDHASTTVAISLPPGSDSDILLPTCHNQHVTANQTVNCPISTSYPSELTLINYSQLTNTQKGAVIGATTGAGLILLSATISVVGGIVSITPQAAATIGALLLIYGGLGAGIGAGIGAARGR